MATADELSRAIAGLGERLGIEGLGLDDEGACALEAGDVMLHLQHFDDVGVLVAYADLGPVPEKAEPAVARLLLAGNMSWRETAGGSLAFHPEMRRACLILRLDTEDLTGEELHQHVAELARAAQDWFERIDELRGGGGAADHGVHEGEDGFDPRHLHPIRG